MKNRCLCESITERSTPSVTSVTLPPPSFGSHKRPTARSTSQPYVTHAAGEQQHIMDEGALQPVEGTGTFINIDLYEQLEALDGVEELRDAMRNIEGNEGAEEKPGDVQA